MSLLDIFRPTYNVTLNREYITNLAEDYINNLSVEHFYKTQPHLRTVVSFIAQNIAQLPLRAYTRDNDGIRQEVNTELAKLLERPNDEQSMYDLLLQTASEYKLYGRAFWYISYGKDRLWEIHAIPNRHVKKLIRNGLYGYSGLEMSVSDIVIPWENIVHFHNYNPSTASGLSPVDTLKNILIEQENAWKFRADMWSKRGVFNEYISRDKDVEPLTEASAKRFVETFSNAWNGKSSGKIPLLEDGMKLNTAQFNSREAQWLEIAQLSLDTVASAYHINSALVGSRTQNSTYASAKENARALYADALAPDLKMISSQLNTRLLDILGIDSSTHYIDFDISAKLEGSFSEMASTYLDLYREFAISKSELRDRLSLGQFNGDESDLHPYNQMYAKGELVPSVKTPQNTKLALKTDESEPSEEEAQEEDEFGLEHAALIAALLGFFKRQERSLSAGIPAGKPFNEDRWNKELAQVIAPFLFNNEPKVAEHYLETIPVDAKYSYERTHNYIDSMARKRAEMINEKTKDDIEALDLENGNTVAQAFADSDMRATVGAGAIFAALKGFVGYETVQQNLKSLDEAGLKAYKTWRTTSGKPRPSHAATEGETVAWDEPFSLGGMFPGDSVMPASETANCMCIMDITYEKE